MFNKEVLLVSLCSKMMFFNKMGPTDAGRDGLELR